jgi:probable phosphoglycerate mutase
MNPTRLFIARHGETEYNRNHLMQGRSIDAPLNETGRNQAEALFRYLNQYEIHRVGSSSLIRAIQTAEPIVKHLDLNLSSSSALDEMDFGDYEGLSYMNLADELKELQKNWENGNLNIGAPGGESPRQVFERANSCVQKLLSDQQGDTLVLVLHGRLIRILLSEWLGYGLKNMHRIQHRNGCINQLVWDGQSFEAVYINKTEHLDNISALKTGTT